MKQALLAGYGLGVSLMCSAGLVLAAEVAPKNFGLDVKITG